MHKIRLTAIAVFSVLAFAGLLAYGQAAQAFPVPECPCDTNMTPDGLTGNEIVDMVCPGGELGDGADFIFSQDEVSVSMQNPDKSYSVNFSDNFGREVFSCTISDGDLGRITRLLPEDYEICRESLIRRCGLIQLRPIPTMSEWGLIATAGVLGLAGIIFYRRRTVRA